MRMQKQLALFLLSLSITLSAHANNASGVSASSPNKLYVTTTGEVTVTFLSTDSKYSDDIFLVGSSATIFNNKTSLIGSTYSLGSFQAGTELVFGMFARDTGYSFFTGPSSPNPDKTHHVSLALAENGGIKIGFEDTFGGGDRDYNDLVFSVSNAKVANISPIPEPAIYSMLVAGLLLVARVSRRRQWV